MLCLHGARPLQLGCCKLLLAILVLPLLDLEGAVLSAELDAELVQLHAETAESWERISNLTSQLQKAGAISPGAVGGLPAASTSIGGAGPAIGAQLPASANPVSPQQVPAATLANLRQLESDFAKLQQTAFRIGRESDDNDAIAQHPEVNNYVQSLREIKTQLQDMASKLAKELQRITGQKVEKPKKQKKAAKTIRGLSEKEIRARTSAELARDTRPFRAKAMDVMPLFRERQMQMQDKQRDMQLAMDGPDWPKEDWPLSTEDARHIGEAENMISSALGALNSKINPIGGLARVHEAGDDSMLEQLVALNEMMSGYGELIDRHVETVRKVYRKSKKQRKSKKSSASSQLPSAGSAPGATESGTLRDRLLNFGAQNDNRQPFSWLREQDSSSRGVDGGFGVSSTQLGSMTGSLSGGFGSQSMPNGPSADGSGTPLSATGGFSSGFGRQGSGGGSSMPLGSTPGSAANGFASQTLPGGSASAPMGSATSGFYGGFGSQGALGGPHSGPASMPLGSMTGAFSNTFGSQAMPGGIHSGSSFSSPLGSVSGSFSGASGPHSSMPSGLNIGGLSSPLGSMAGGSASMPLGSTTGSFSGGLGSQIFPGALHAGRAHSPLGSMAGGFAGGFASQHLPPQPRTTREL